MSTLARRLERLEAVYYERRRGLVISWAESLSDYDQQSFLILYDHYGHDEWPGDNAEVARFAAMLADYISEGMGRG